MGRILSPIGHDQQDDRADGGIKYRRSRIDDRNLAIKRGLWGGFRWLCNAKSNGSPVWRFWRRIGWLCFWRPASNGYILDAFGRLAGRIECSSPWRQRGKRFGRDANAVDIQSAVWRLECWVSWYGKNIGHDSDDRSFCEFRIWIGCWRPGYFRRSGHCVGRAEMG